jgi:hypothetical protein
MCLSSFDQDAFAIAQRKRQGGRSAKVESEFWVQPTPVSL